ncbi:MAG: hypothetical protein JRI45_12150 [Deltaproteobacteria bacterium]|nr:hypothetical protein [Deltaproteobacteria bacterium]
MVTIVPQCADCKLCSKGFGVCKAYPKGIPDKYLYNEEVCVKKVLKEERGGVGGKD